MSVFILSHVVRLLVVCDVRRLLGARSTCGTELLSLHGCIMPTRSIPRSASLACVQFCVVSARHGSVGWNSRLEEWDSVRLTCLALFAGLNTCLCDTAVRKIGNLLPYPQLSWLTLIFWVDLFSCSVCPVGFCKVPAVYWGMHELARLLLQNAQCWAGGWAACCRRVP